LTENAPQEYFPKAHTIIQIAFTSRPAKGEMFTEKDILTVGSSTLIVGKAVPVSLSANVSPIYMIRLSIWLWT
jgi:hypothetical protein